jgi:voltage-gated potassium channel Kch
MQHHIIVSGDDALATTIIEELESAGANVVRLANGEFTGVAQQLDTAAVADALAVVCAGDDDAANLEIALLARRANPSVRVVARLANDVLRAAVADDNGPGAILDVAELTAPSVVEACLAHRTHPFEAAGIQFLVSGSEAPRAATLREIYGDLAPVAVIHGENSSSPGEIEVCPTRNHRVLAGDRAVMIGTADESAERGIKVRRPAGTRPQRPRLRRVLDAVRTVINDFNPAFYPALAAALTLVVGSMFLLRFNYRHPRMSWIDALYFTIETITTTGYGDFSFVRQPTWLRLFAAMMMFGGVTTIALLVAFVGDVLLSQRFILRAAHPRIGHLSDHVVVVGLSALGIRVVGDLVAAGYGVAVIEIDEDNKFLSEARELDVPVIFGDATLHKTLEGARVDRARAVTVLTRDDMTNIETGMVVARKLGRPLARCTTGPTSVWYCECSTGRWVSRWRSGGSALSTPALLWSWQRPGSPALRSACGSSTRSRWDNARSSSERLESPRAASSTGCAWMNCPPTSELLPSPVPTTSWSFALAATGDCAPRTASISWGPTVNYSILSAEDKRLARPPPTAAAHRRTTAARPDRRYKTWLIAEGMPPTPDGQLVGVVGRLQIAAPARPVNRQRGRHHLAGHHPMLGGEFVDDFEAARDRRGGVHDDGDHGYLPNYLKQFVAVGPSLTAEAPHAAHGGGSLRDAR